MRVDIHLPCHRVFNLIMRSVTMEHQYVLTAMFFMLLMIFEMQSVSCDNFSPVRMYDSISFNLQILQTTLVALMCSRSSC